MNYKISIISVLMLLFVCSCKTQKSEKVVAETEPTVIEKSIDIIDVPEPEPELERPELPKGESLVVSFYSIGSGINNEAVASFNSYLNGLGVKYKQIAWGREGEQDFCFSKSDLAAIDYEVFISKVRSMLQDEEHVTIGENAKCRF